jgi:hypothetical protein
MLIHPVQMKKRWGALCGELILLTFLAQALTGFTCGKILKEIAGPRIQK